MANAQAAIRLLESPAAGADGGAGELRAILADVVDDDRRASDVIRRLRDLLKNGRPADECFDLGASIQDIASLVKSDAVIRNVTVKLELARASAFVRGDRVQLQQVVLNLLVNALEASDAASGGGGRVEVECRCRNDGVAEVTVRDSGTRPGSVARRAGVRAVLHHQARRHGDGTVDRALDRRSARRPHPHRQRPRQGRRDRGVHDSARSRRAAPMTGSEPGIAGPVIPGPVIAVIDDEASVRRSLDRLLRAYGFRVQTFASGDEFLERPADVEPPACLIVDLRMAGKTGLDVVDALRARAIEIPVIMITGHGEVSMADRAGKGRAVEFLAKPVDGDVLLQAIARALGQPGPPPTGSPSSYGQMRPIPR